MPQMFPMPFALLMLATTAIFMLSMVRVYWQSPYSCSQSVSAAADKVDLQFKQVW